MKGLALLFQTIIFMSSRAKIAKLLWHDEPLQSNLSGPVKMYFPPFVIQIIKPLSGLCYLATHNETSFLIGPSQNSALWKPADQYELRILIWPRWGLHYSFTVLAALLNHTSGMVRMSRALLYRTQAKQWTCHTHNFSAALCSEYHMSLPLLSGRFVVCCTQEAEMILKGQCCSLLLLLHQASLLINVNHTGIKKQDLGMVRKYLYRHRRGNNLGSHYQNTCLCKKVLEQ